jgi:hypothetical protein
MAIIDRPSTIRRAKTRNNNKQTRNAVASLFVLFLSYIYSTGKNDGSVLRNIGSSRDFHATEKDGQDGMEECHDEKV